MTAIFETPQLVRPASYPEAARALEELGEDARVLGGGQSLTIMIRLGLARPSGLVSLARCPEAAVIERVRGALRLGARVTVATAAQELADVAPAVADAARQVASPHVRNVGTVVGNVCHADPGNDLAVSLLCHDAEVVVHSTSGQRRVRLDELVAGPFQTTLEPGEFVGTLVVGELAGWQGAYRKLIWRGADHPVAGVAATLRLDGDRIAEARVALGAALPVPRRLAEVEAALAGLPVERAPEAAMIAAAAALRGLHVTDEPEAPAMYRRKVATAMAGDAVAAALGLDVRERGR